MKKIVAFLFLLSLMLSDLNAQNSVKTFIFGHSLIHHEIQIHETASQETSVPHWFQFLSEEAGYEYAVSGQYGFLPQHANLPPQANWWFEYVTGAWDSENEAFSEADFTNILITPGNFIQWQAPTENYYGENFSPIDKTDTIFSWCLQREDSLSIYIYENWPDMGGFLGNGFPPSESEWNDYNDYLNGDFHDWFIEYHDILVDRFPNACISMIPVGPIISKLLQQSPYDQIPIDTLYEDGAPHGRPSIYFLAALTTYMAMHEEKAPVSYQVNEEYIDPIIVENYGAVVDFIWNELNEFTDNDGNSKVFCSTPIVIATDDLIRDIDLTISANPTNGLIYFRGVFESHTIDVFSIQGRECVKSIQVNSNGVDVDLSYLENGAYLIIGKNDNDVVLYRKRIIKM